MQELAERPLDILAVGSSLGIVWVVADISATAVGYSIVSPKTLRPRKYRKVCSAAGMDPTERGWGFLRCLDMDGKRLTS